ncbi:MAG: hypothetical protein FMNOHCHN_02039 [Ignavibacteriaceae bacterium]|nr:hypothetical protein [Ignavibacteriaceae bacterium]
MKPIQGQVATCPNVYCVVEFMYGIGQLASCSYDCFLMLFKATKP